MIPVPKNRYLLIEKIDEQEQSKESLVLIPEEYRPSSPYTPARIVRGSSDCNKEWKVGTVVLVPTGTVETVSYNQNDYYLVLENHVLMGFEEDPYDL